MNIQRSAKLLAIIALAIGSFAAAIANATIQTVEAIPTAWRLENYSIDESVVVWFAVSPACSTSGLKLPTYATQEQRDRLFAAVATGKIAGRKIGIRYDDSACTMDSFIMSKADM